MLLSGISFFPIVVAARNYLRLGIFKRKKDGDPNGSLREENEKSSEGFSFPFKRDIFQDASSTSVVSLSALPREMSCCNGYRMELLMQSTLHYGM